DGIEEGGIIKQLNNEEYIVCGNSTSGIDGDKTQVNFGARDFWLVKMDSIGNKVWDFVYGGTLTELAGNGLNSLLSLPDGNFIFGGTTNSPLSGNISDTSKGGFDVWILNIDSFGNIIWDKRFGGSSADKVKHISQTRDKGYIICSETNSPQSGDVSDTSRGGISDFWILKIDSVGNKLWDKRYGGNQLDIPMKIVEDFDGGYWVGGITNSDLGAEISEPPIGDFDYWIIKIDSIGNKIWDKRFGGPSGNFLTDFILLPDSSIMLFGSADSGTSSIKTDPGKGASDYWLVHFYYGPNPVGIKDVNETIYNYSVYPNPASYFITIEMKENNNPFTFTLKDLVGRKILSRHIQSNQTIDISEYPSSLYLYEIITNENIVLNGKIVVY
ncbi:MAG: T9SS type A sorting domain-containing protein, partial [Nitrosopumilus sp.]|nr:T9SS type A sorting domain-containing protein [Nitrosopumilus sp.]